MISAKIRILLLTLYKTETMKRILTLILLPVLMVACGGKNTYTYSVEEISVKSGENNIWGQLYIPDGVKKAPLVVFSHGFGATYMSGVPYAEALAPKGYAVCCYDFCGGSVWSRSEGKTSDMSIFTEAEDLKAVIDDLCEREFIDPKRVILIGESQGGMVSSLVAAERKDKIERLVLVFPAFCIPDDWVKMFPKLDDMPEEMDFWGMKLGHAYLEGLYDLDVYKTVSQYEGPVSIFHGDQDKVVNVSYSERALEAYKNATLKVLPGEGHGFKPEVQKEVIGEIAELL